MPAKISTTIGVPGPGSVQITLAIGGAIFARLIEDVFSEPNRQETVRVCGTENPSVRQLADNYFATGKLQKLLNGYPPAFQSTFQA